jgi:NAD-dependent histone deacetylase SIR2
MTRQANPTLFHHMIATLAEEGRLMRLYTQNVDGIDTSLEPLRTNVPLNSRGPWPKTIQLHGGLEKMVCTKCRALSDFDASLFEGSEPPSCKACEELDEIRTTMAGKRSHGIGRLRPRIVLYNEYNPDEEAIGAVTTADLKSRPDAVIVVGTSLKVPGVRRIAREMCQVARGRKDGFTAWINNAPEPVGPEFKDCWNLVIRGDCDEVARQAAIPKWDDKDIGTYNIVTGQDTQRSSIKVEVNGGVKHKAVEKTQGMVTPTASPRTRSPAPAKDLKKMKQPKLFATASTTATKPTKPATSTATKKKPAKKPAAAKNNKITKAFTTTKASKPSSVKLSKQAAPSLAPLFPNLGKAPSAMLPLSPVEVRNNTESTSYHVFDSKPQYDIKTEVPASPDSPSAQLRSEGRRRETVSPGSLPRNMAHLLET